MDSNDTYPASQPSELPWDVLDRYLAGEATPGDRAQVGQWVAERSWHAAALAALHDPATRGVVRRTRDVDGWWRRGMRLERERGVWGRQTPRLGMLRFSRWAIASALILVAAFALRRWTIPSVGRTGSVETQTYRTAAGQRETVRLHDGSTITLGPATTVAIGVAGVDVTGEAYFTIVPHVARPTVVRTLHAVVQVLGTSFGVRQYAGEPMTRVVVDDGRVLVKTRVHSSVPASPAVLASRMVAQVSDSIITVTSGITTREYTSWTQGVLVFNNVPLHNVVGELARAYGVDIRIADTVLAKQIIGIEISVTKHSINQVLGSMCHVTNAHYSYDGQSYVISPGRVATKSPRVAPSRYSFPQPEQQYGR